MSEYRAIRIRRFSHLFRSLPSLHSTSPLLPFSLTFRRIYLFFVIPMPAIVFAGAFVISDTLGLYKTSRPGRQRVAHSGHLGGALAGATVIGVLRFVFRVVR